jgi:hypothetical protein
VASGGSVYVADNINDRIQKFTSEGLFVIKWGTEGTGDGEFNSPNGVAVASDGSVYVADTGNRRIQKFTSEGVFVIKWGVGAGVGEYGDPYGIAIASDGSVYVADKINRRIQKFTSEGLFVSKWGSTGKGNGEFYNLYGVAVATNGNVYVADTFNNRIQKFSVVPTATPQLKPTAIPTIYPTDTPMPVPTPTSIPTSAPRPIPTAPPPTMKPPTPTPRPTATPKPSRAISFSDGTWVVGSDILHGTYRSSRTGGGCYWERLSSFSGGFGDIIANEITDELSLVEISSTDAGFSTRDCGTWKKATTRITSSLTSPFGDGAFIVGLDIASGTWSSPGGGSCYWERLSGFSGELRHIEANDVGGFNNIVTIQSTDIGFSSSDCGSWTKQ